ncbi:MAG: hypothetical protein ACYDIA_07275 [Candidatus Humimicrobiaceae bacterium]
MSYNFDNALMVPAGVFFADDAASSKRKQIAEALRQGKDVSVTSTGEVVQSNDPTVDQQKVLNVPEGKHA